ncbi:MAG: LysR family transcriptional regulator [Pseudomonadota bacterium]
MTIEPAWDYYRTFLSVLRNGSLSAAARELHLTQPTVGRQVAALEHSLGGKALFTRSQAGLLPTRIAFDLQPHAEAMAASAAVILRASTGASAAMRGAVRVSASDVIGIEVLPAALRTFTHAHPGIAIELSLSNQTVDLLKRDADVAVRMVRPRQQALFAKRVGRVFLGFHAHRQYLDRHGTPTRMDDLHRHIVIGFDHMPVYAKGLKFGGRQVSRDLFAFRTDSDPAQLAAVRAGVGLGVCQYALARRNSDLVPVLTKEFSLSFEIWVVMHEDQKNVERVRTMFDHLAGAMADYCAAAGPPKS